MKLPTNDERKTFLRVDGGWESLGGDHERFRKRLPNGDVLRTKISRGSTQMGDLGQWKEILRSQLRVTEAEFWNAVENGIPPARESTATGADEDSETPIPAWLVERLIHTVGMPQEEVAGLSSEAAEEAWYSFRSRPKT